jgi:hypothetical protein
MMGVRTAKCTLLLTIHATSTFRYEPFSCMSKVLSSLTILKTVKSVLVLAVSVTELY